MAYNGYLIRLGGANGTIFPLKYMALESYKAAPDQVLDLDSGRDTTGVMHRTVLEHTATKVEFTTPNMTTNAMWREIWSIIRQAIGSNAGRKLTLEYYDEFTDSYKTGTFYMPDVNFNIHRIDKATNTIYYLPIRIAFIEY